jgi:hypothetical protein
MFPDGRALDSPDQTISAVGDYTKKMLAVGSSKMEDEESDQGGGMPVWMMLQAGAWEEYRTPGTARDEAAVLYPSHRQMRYMAFADVISGATGLLFNMPETPVGKPIWRDIATLVHELRALEPALAGGRVFQSPTPKYTNLGFTIWKGVDTLVTRDGTGRVYLFAVNNAMHPAEVLWQGLPAGTTAVRVVRDRSGAAAADVDGEARVMRVDAAGAALDAERFEGYDVIVYEIVIGGAGAATKL